MHREVIGLGFEAILVDLDGVLRHWPAGDHELEARYGLPAGALHEEAFSHRQLDPAIRGTVSDAEWRRRVAEALLVRHPGSDAASAVAAWSAGAGVLDVDALELLRRCAPRNGIVLLTNATSRLADDLERLGLDDAFAAVVNSTEIGYVKPEPGIFRVAIRVCGCSARDILYIDDDARNVGVAIETGIAGHRYESLRSLEALLARAGFVRRAESRS